MTLQATICWLVAGVFVVALQHKLRQFERFAADLSAYDLLPAPLVRTGARLVIALEITAVATLLLSPATGASLAASLLALYACAMAINLARGRTEIDCGCGEEPTTLSRALIWRNLLLIGLAGSVASAPVAVQLMPMVAGLGLGAVALLLYLSAEQVLANSSRRHRLWGSA